jgi:hypothetical protein
MGVRDGYMPGRPAGGTVPSRKPGGVRGGYQPTAPAPPPIPVSSADQKLLNAFKQIDPERRVVSLKAMQEKAQAGDKEAYRKLQLLLPHYEEEAPATPDYKAKDLGSVLYRTRQALPGAAKEVAKGIAHSFADTGKTITSLPHALNAAGISLASMAEHQHGEQLAKSKQKALDEIQKTPYGKNFGKTVAENNAKPIGKQLAGIGGKTLENVLNAATLNVGTGTAKAVASKEAQKIAAKQAVKNEGGYVRDLASGKFSKTAVHPDDASVMATFIDHARGIGPKLSEREAYFLERDAGRLAEHYGLPVVATAKAGDPLKRLATSFDKVLRGSPEALRGTKLGESGHIGLPSGKTVMKPKNLALEGTKLGAAYGVAQAGQAGTTDPLELAKTVGIGAAAGGLLGAAPKLLKKAATTGKPVVAKDAVQALKANPSRLAEARSEAKAVVGNEEGRLGSKAPEPITPAIDELHNKVISGVPKSKRIDVAKGKIKGFAQKVDTELHDKYAPVRNLVSVYEQATGRKLSAEENAYVLSRLNSGSTDRATQRIGDLGDILREAPDIQAAKDIGIAQRILTDRSGIKNPISQDTARQVIEDYKQRLGPEAFAKTQETVQKVIKFHDIMLKELVDEGIISKEAYEAIKAKNQNYFGKFDVVDHLLENSDNLRKGASFNVAKQDLIKAQKGTESAIADPIEASIRQIAKAADLISRNRVGNALYKMSKDAPELVTKMKNDTVPAGYEKISTFVNGKKIDLAVPKDVGEALKHLNAQQTDLVTKTASLTGNILRKTATSLNTGFAFISNPIRDAQSFALNSKYVAKNPVSLAKAWLEGFAQAGMQGPLYREFLSAGGGQSTFFNPKQVTKTAKQIIRTPAEAAGHTIINPKQLFGIIPVIENAGQVLELAPRLAEFKAAKAAGKSATQAAVDARNVTVDFSQSGNIGQVLNQWVPFLNARLQGNLKGLEAIKRNPVGSAVVVTSYIGLPTVATYMWNRQHFSDVYDQIPQYIKDSNMVIVYGDHKNEAGQFDQVIKIPKGDFAKVFGNSLEEFLNFVYKKDPKSLDRVALEAMSSLSPIDFTRDGKFSASQAIGSSLPPLIKGGVENASNYSFFKGGPLVPTSLQQLPNNEQVGANTSLLARALGNATGQSPIKTDNLLSSFTAGTAKTYQSPQDFAKSTIGRVSGAPSNNAENRFYDVLERTTPLKNSASKRINSAIAADNLDEARRIAEDYNKELESNFADTQKNYGKFWTDDLKQLYEDQKIDLNYRSIAQRKARLKK